MHKQNLNRKYRPSFKNTYTCTQKHKVFDFTAKYDINIKFSCSLFSIIIIKFQVTFLQFSHTTHKRNIKLLFPCAHYTPITLTLGSLNLKFKNPRPTVFVGVVQICAPESARAEVQKQKTCEDNCH